MKNISRRTHLHVAWLAVLVVAAPCGADNEPLFESPWRAFGAGDFPTFGPAYVAMGDIDLDGDLDAVLGREFFGGPGVSVLRANGDGTFALPDVYTLPHSKDVKDVALNDFDGDGDLDVIASVYGNAGTNWRIAVWPNDGAGTLGERREFATGMGPTGIAVSDFSGDGFADVVTANARDESVSLLVHNGAQGNSAGYLEPIHFAVGASVARVEAADLNGDDRPDLVVGRGHFSNGGPHGVSVLLNDGEGGFDAPVDYVPIQNAYRISPAIAVADMDQDGDVDILAAGAINGIPSYGIAAILWNDGEGGFSDIDEFRFVGWTFTPYALHAADLNGDGWNDIIGSTPSGRASDGFNVLMSNGNGGFESPVRYEAAKQTFDLATDDVDDDGDLDVLTVANDSSVLTVHLNPGDGEFLILPRINVGSLNRDMVKGDLDNDGDMDLVTGGSSDVHILRNVNGNFNSAQQFDTPFSPNDVHLADMNNDGFLDLIIRSYSFGVALNNGSGSFLPMVVTPTGSSQAGEVSAFDLDNDGNLDIVATDPGPASRVYLFRNHGNGTTYSLANIIADDDGLPFGIGGGDFNGDNNVDLLFNNALGLTAYLGNGNFGFSPPEPTSTQGYPFIVADVNGDDRLDIAFQYPQESFGTVFVGVMLGFGDGGFDFPEPTPGPNGRESAYRISSDLDVYDATGDGHADLILTNNAPNDVHIFAGDGAGGLALPDRYGVGYSASDSAVHDFTGDDVVDIATIISLAPSGLGDAVVVMRGTEAEREPTPAALTEFELLDGTLVAGGLEQLRQSDNAYVQIEARVTGEVAQPHLLRMAVEAVTEIDAPQSLQLRFESRITDIEAAVWLYLRDVNTGTLVEVGRFTAGMSEEVAEVVVPDAARFVANTTGTIGMEVKAIVFVPFTLGGFHMFIDHVEIGVR